MAVATSRRPAGTGSIYPLRGGRWQGALRGPGRLRRYVSGASRDEVERKLARLRDGEVVQLEHPRLEHRRGRPNPILVSNRLGIIQRALASAREGAWTDDRTAQVLDAWLSPRRVRAGVVGPCVYCGDEAASTVDHAIPLSRGGTDEADNLVSACKPCNERKGALTVDEFTARSVA